jgi:hypothetical protein
MLASPECLSLMKAIAYTSNIYVNRIAGWLEENIGKYSGRYGRGWSIHQDFETPFHSVHESNALMIKCSSLLEWITNFRPGLWWQLLQIFLWWQHKTEPFNIQNHPNLIVCIDHIQEGLNTVLIYADLVPLNYRSLQERSTDQTCGTVTVSTSNSAKRLMI